MPSCYIFCWRGRLWWWRVERERVANVAVGHNNITTTTTTTAKKNEMTTVPGFRISNNRVDWVCVCLWNRKTPFFFFPPPIHTKRQVNDDNGAKTVESESKKSLSTFSPFQIKEILNKKHLFSLWITISLLCIILNRLSDLIKKVLAFSSTRWSTEPIYKSRSKKSYFVFSLRLVTITSISKSPTRRRQTTSNQLLFVYSTRMSHIVYIQKKIRLSSCALYCKYCIW